MKPIDRADADACARLRFGAYLRYAAERGAVAITLTSLDVAELAALIREADGILGAEALTADSLAEWAKVPPALTIDPDILLSRFDALTTQEDPMPNVMCRCAIALAASPHLCPYEEDVMDDPNSECDCCEACEQACREDI